MNIAPVRLGHPARVNTAVSEYSLDALIMNHDGTEIVQDVRNEINKHLKSLQHSRKGKVQRREVYSELRVLRKEAKVREQRVVKSILENANVVLCTLVGASSYVIKDIEFDMVVIDEAAQALEAACWIPMQKANKVVLAGDHCQLPPTVKSTLAEQGGLGRTLFERIISSKPTRADFDLSHVSRLLNIQYRMNHAICDWASSSMYNGRLTSAEQVRDHTLRDLVSTSRPPQPSPPLPDAATPRGGLSDTECGEGGGVGPERREEEEEGIPVMLLLDTSGGDMEEEPSRGGSHSNPREAEVVCVHVRHLLASGLSPQDIGVITPYNGQVDVLRALLHPVSPNLSVRTVDGFQGGEKEAIVLSLVRSNERREVGFLADRRRINVAVTRARRHLAVVCDVSTCTSDPFLESLLSHISDNGDHRSAMEYVASVTACAVTVEGKDKASGLHPVDVDRGIGFGLPQIGPEESENGVAVGVGNGDVPNECALPSITSAQEPTSPEISEDPEGGTAVTATGDEGNESDGEGVQPEPSTVIDGRAVTSLAAVSLEHRPPSMSPVKSQTLDHKETLNSTGLAKKSVKSGATARAAAGV
eukprot:gene8271-10596_t